MAIPSAFRSFFLACISLATLVQVLKERRRKRTPAPCAPRTAPAAFSSTCPVLGVDLSVLIYAVFARFSGALSPRPDVLARALVEELRRYILAGFDVLIVSDNDVRHFSKLSSLKRRARRRHHCAVIAELSNELRTNPELAEKEAKLLLLRRLQKDVRPIPEGLVDALWRAFAEDKDPRLAAHAHFLQAAFQADTELASHCTHGDVDAVLSSDADLVVYGAPLLVRHGIWGLKDGDMQIATLDPNLFKARELSSHLRDCQKPTLPNLFQHEYPLELRALVALVVGCDVNLSGVPGIGVKTLNNLLADSNMRDFDALLAFAVKRGSVSQSVLNWGVKAFVYEPVHHTLDQDSALCYVHGIAPPQQLPRTLKDFALGSVTLVGPEDDAVRLCVPRCSNGPHEVLQCNSGHFCRICEEAYCTTCIYEGSVAEGEFVCPNCTIVALSRDMPDALEPDVAMDCGLSPPADSPLQCLLELVMSTIDVPEVEVLLPNGKVSDDVLQRATVQELDDFLRATNLVGWSGHSREQKAALVKGIAEGHVATPLRADPDSPAFDAAKKKVAASSLPESWTWWASPLPQPAKEALLVLGQDFLERLNFEDFAFVVRLLCALENRDNKGRYMDDSMTFLSPRLLGLKPRIQRMAMRAAMSPWAVPVLLANAAVVETPKGKALFVEHKVHPSFEMDKGMYDTKMWLGEERILSMNCSCKAGRLACFHPVSVLSQLETGVLVPNEVAALVIDVLARQWGSEEYLTDDFFKDALFPLASRVFPGVGADELRARVLAGTEKPKCAPAKPKDAPDIVLLRDWKHKTPEKAMQRKRPREHGAKKAPVRAQLASANLFPEGFDPTVFDYQTIFAAMQKSLLHPEGKHSRASDSVAFVVMGLHAKKQAEAATQTNVPPDSLPDALPPPVDAGAPMEVGHVPPARRRHLRVTSARVPAALPLPAIDGDALAPMDVDAGSPHAPPPPCAGAGDAPVAGTVPADLPPLPAASAKPAKDADADGTPPTKRRAVSKTKVCAFAGCKCRHTTPSTAGMCDMPWHVMPKVTAQPGPLRDKRMRCFAADYRAIGWRGKLPSPTSHYEICGHHQLTPVGRPMPIGVAAAQPPQQPSRGSGSARADTRTLSAFDETAKLVMDMAAENERLRAELQCAEAAAKQAFHEGVLHAHRTGVRYETATAEYLWHHARVSSKEDFEAVIMFLTNGDPRVETNSYVLKSRDVNCAGIYLKPQSRAGHSGRGSKLSFRDRVLLYLVHEYSGARTETLAVDYRVSAYTVRSAVMSIAVMMHQRRVAFGQPTYKEYLELVSEDWKKTWGTKFCWLWDATNANLAGKPSDAWGNWGTYSKYYAGNCAKLLVGYLACCWVRGAPAAMGAISDSAFMRLAGIFEEQQQQSESEGAPPVTNITDKGFKSADDAQKAGGQTIVTPCFQRVGHGQRQFSEFEMIFGRIVAQDRAVNERAVHLPKVFGFLRNPIPLSCNFELWDIIWQNVCFRCNWCFKPLSAKALAQWKTRFPDFYWVPRT